MSSLMTAEVLADFVLTTNYADIPDAVKQEAPRAMHNWVGCVVGGMHHKSVAIARRAAAVHSGNADATVLGGGRELDPQNAALVNCIANSAYAFDDTHFSTATHPTGPVASALLALAEWRAKVTGAQVTGEAFAAALLLGIEVECRLACAFLMPPARGNDSWYITGVVGGIGAAVACAKIMGLSRSQTISAIGIAASQGAGFRATHGSMAIGFVPGNAARAGLQAAIFAEAGFDCSPHILDGPHGMAQVFAAEANMAAAHDDLGTRWEVLENAYKPYPCGFVIHPSLDLCLDFHRENPAVKPASISRIELRVSPLCISLCDRPAPANAASAMVSMQHWSAACLARGSAGMAETAEEAVQDPAIRMLVERIEAVGDDSMARDAAAVIIEHSDGQVWERSVAHCLGSLANQMSNAQLDAKFLAQAKGILSEPKATALAELCWHLPDLADVAAIARAAVPD